MCENRGKAAFETVLEASKRMESFDFPPAGDLVVVTHDVVIPASELQFRFSRSSGPGGQHVNRSETRVELLFDIRNSPSLSAEQRQRLLLRMKTHLDNDGVLHVVSSETRSQLENRARCVARFQVLLRGALARRKRRIPTAPSAASRERRLASKRARSSRKDTRRGDRDGDYD
jgi:ribosome-associated protein